MVRIPIGFVPDILNESMQSIDKNQY